MSVFQRTTCKYFKSSLKESSQSVNILRKETACFTLMQNKHLCKLLFNHSVNNLHTCTTEANSILLWTDINATWKVWPKFSSMRLPLPKFSDTTLELSLLEELIWTKKECLLLKIVTNHQFGKQSKILTLVITTQWSTLLKIFKKTACFSLLHTTTRRLTKLPLWFAKRGSMIIEFDSDNWKPSLIRSLEDLLKSSSKFTNIYLMVQLRRWCHIWSAEVKNLNRFSENKNSKTNS